MISLQNSTNQKFSTSISSSNSRKWQSQTKLQGHATVTATVATQSLYITSALIVMEHQRTGTKATENPHTTQTPELSTKGLSRATSGGAGGRAAASNRGLGQGRGPYTPRPLYYMYHDNETNHCTKDCPIYINTKHKILCHNYTLERSTTPCDVHRATSNIPHYTLRIIQHKHTKILRTNLQPTTNHTTMPPQPS
jgi:hypothetical protein